MTTQSIHHLEHSKPQGPHFNRDEHLPETLGLLEDAAVGIDEIVRVLEQSEDLSKVIQAEAEAVAKTSLFGREVKSLKHAVALLGLNRLHAILLACSVARDQEVTQTA